MLRWRDSGIGEIFVFAASALAIIPLAKILGEATEVLAEKTGPRIGGLLNATFGNAAELIITLAAIRAGQMQLVLASMAARTDGSTKRMKWIRQQNQAAMKSVAIELILLLVLSLAAPAFAAYESGPVGPYNVSFDMNTTMEYRVIVEAASSGVTSLGVNFTRYNLTIDSADYLAWLILTRYDEPMVANISANEYIVYSALLNAGADKPNLYQPLIDGKPGVLGNFRFERQFLGQGQYQEGDLIIAASYSPDGRVYEDGVYRGRTDCRVISTFPWEIISYLLYTLHVEVPKEEGASIDPDNLSPLINQSSLTNQS
jgi:hypothetical protein